VNRWRRAVGILATAFIVPSACGDDTLGGDADDGTPEFAGYQREPLPEVGSLSLADATAEGAPFELRAEPGGLLLVYFGYMNCPDYCPTTMSDVKLARARLDDPERVSVAMVTVDPDRDLVTDEARCDDGAVLACYVRSFVPDAHALGSDDDAALAAAAAPFGVTYNVETSGDESIVSHSTSLYAVDDQGRLVLTWQFGTAIDDLAADIEALLGAPTA
jgi:protein SCO1